MPHLLQRLWSQTVATWKVRRAVTQCHKLLSIGYAARGKLLEPQYSADPADNLLILRG